MFDIIYCMTSSEQAKQPSLLRLKQDCEVLLLFQKTSDSFRVGTIQLISVDVEKDWVYKPTERAEDPERAEGVDLSATAAAPLARPPIPERLKDDRNPQTESERARTNLGGLAITTDPSPLNSHSIFPSNIASNRVFRVA